MGSVHETEASLHGPNDTGKNRTSGENADGKKTSDTLLDELFSVIRDSGEAINVAEIITEDKRSQKERERSSSRSRSHKHKKSRKEKKHKKKAAHRSRSRDHKRNRRGRSSSSSRTSENGVKKGTLGEILIKTKNLSDLHKQHIQPISSQVEEEDDLPVGADYRTVMHEAVASSSTTSDPSGEPLLPVEEPRERRRMEPSFPLSKTEKKAKEDGGSEMLKKVLSEKGGSSLVPRKLQLDIKKTNGGPNSYGPALPPTEKDVDEGAENVDLTVPRVKPSAKISFGQITLKVDSTNEQTLKEHGEKQIVSNVEMTENKDKKEKAVETNSKAEKSKETGKESTASKKLSVRRRRSSSVSCEEKKTKRDKRERDIKRSKERERERDKERRDRSIEKRRRRSREGRETSRERRDDRRGRRRSRSRSPLRKEWRRSRSSSRTRERRRTRSRSAEKIDKKKLLEIALQNAKGVAGPTAEKQGVNMKILEKAGGRNIGDIVSYCQKLSEAEKGERIGESDDDDESGGLSRKREIKLNIPDSKQLATRTPRERLVMDVPLRAAFPVSSGAIHRDSEWKKVEPNTAVPSVCTADQKKLVATSSLTKVKAAKEGKSVPAPAFPILPPPPLPPKIKGDLIPPPPPPPSFSSSSLVPPPPLPPVIITPSADLLIETQASKYEEGTKVDAWNRQKTRVVKREENMKDKMKEDRNEHDIYRLLYADNRGFLTHKVSVTPLGRRMEEWKKGVVGLRRRMKERSDCVARLVDDPNDYEARRLMKDIDDELKGYGKCAELSGRWQGHTRVNMLSADELAPRDARYHSWIKKDLFKNTAPVVSGVGMKLMQKMGWKPGDGLGREQQGDLEPLVLDVKSDRKGLYSDWDVPISKSKLKTKSKVPSKPGEKVVEDRNAISTLMELCQRKKWTLPQFVFHEEGRLGSKKFTCIVKLNGMSHFGPESLNKKVAKTEAARIALEKIGFAAPNVATPQIYDPSSEYSVPEQIVHAHVRQVMRTDEYAAVAPPCSFETPAILQPPPPPPPPLPTLPSAPPPPTPPTPIVEKKPLAIPPLPCKPIRKGVPVWTPDDDFTQDIDSPRPPPYSTFPSYGRGEMGGFIPPPNYPPQQLNPSGYGDRYGGIGPPPTNTSAYGRPPHREHSPAYERVRFF